MWRMRALGAIAGLVFALGGLTGAGAADLPPERGAAGYNHAVGYTYYVAVGRRAAPLVIYDDQPGVAMRAYWRAPWQDRHYYPATGRRPRIGRLEHVSVRRGWRPAESYRRFWSTSSAILPELPRGRVREFDLEPVPQRMNAPLERPLK
jgi:hypothetical protein